MISHLLTFLQYFHISPRAKDKINTMAPNCLYFGHSSLYLIPVYSYPCAVFGIPLNPLTSPQNLPDWPVFVYLCARYSLSLNLQNIHAISYFRLLVFAQIIFIYWVVSYTTFKILPPPSEYVFLFPWFIFSITFFFKKNT